MLRLVCAGMIRLELLLVYLLAGIVFAVLLGILGRQPKKLRAVCAWILLTASVIGLFYYGYGYYAISRQKGEGLFLPVAKTIRALFFMVTGKDDIKTVADAKIGILSEPLCSGAIHIVHAAALFATAGTILISFCQRLMDQLRLRLSLLLPGEKTVHLIFGTNEKTVRFAEELMKEAENKRTICLFTAEEGASCEQRIRDDGFFLLRGKDAAEPQKDFLRRLKIKSGRTRFRLYCLSGDFARNQNYALSAGKALREVGREKKNAGARTADRCSATVITDDSSFGDLLQNASSFGSVLALSWEELFARLLIRKYPPYETVRFASDGSAADPCFETVIVGFGRTGQTILRYLIMNSQFEGSRFHALAVDPCYEREAGPFLKNFGALMRPEENCLGCSVDGLSADARSREVYEYLDRFRRTDRDRRLKYIVVCTDQDGLNREIALGYSNYLGSRLSGVQIIECTASGIRRYLPEENAEPEQFEFYAPEILCAEKTDASAVKVHFVFNDRNGDPQTLWRSCRYFHRQSSRASADFLPALVKAAGQSAEKLGKIPADSAWWGGASPDVLAKTEHLRWCAFHYCMGYRTMTAEEAVKRKEQLKDEKPWQDPGSKRHACLVAWNALEDLGEALGMEREYFPEADRRLIRNIPLMLQDTYICSEKTL